MSDESVKDIGETSDGYHTFNELYEHRHALTLALMRIAAFGGESWWSRIHNDGTPSYDGWLLCGVDLPNGTITYHLPERLLPEILSTGAMHLVQGKEWDGHDAAEVVRRLKVFACGGLAVED